MSRLMIATLLFLHGILGQATTLPQVPLSELIEHADVVAFVQIVKSELLKDVRTTEGEIPCGASYEARVIEMLKGEITGTTFRFGHYEGYGVGNRYVVFLADRKNAYDPKDSTNGAMEQFMQLQATKCKNQWPPLSVTHSGNGTLPVNWSSQFEYKDSVRVPARYIRLPKGLQSKPAKLSDGEANSDAVWVRLQDFLQSVRDLGR